MTNFKQIVTHTIRFDDYTIRVINMRDGFAWYEYRISRAGEFLTESADEYGSPASAASAAFQWIADHGDPPVSLTDEQIRQMLDDEPLDDPE